MFRSLSTAVLLLLLALPGVALAQGTGTIAGRVLEADGVTAIIGANVRVGGTTLGAATDLDGNYRIIGVPVGAYDVTASYTGFPSVTITGAEINAGSTRQLNFTLASSDNTTDVVDIVYEAPLITNDAVGQSRVATGADLENLPIRGVAATVALQAGGVVSTEGSSDLNIRGGRSEEVQYFVDGVRVSGLLGVNQQAIEQQEVLIGTIPARYGDVQSGVISITTKTGSDRFFGSAEGVTSTGLDSYGYNLGSLSLGGPIVPGRVGFFISGELQATEDSNPYGTQTYRLRDDVYQDLQLRPQVIQIRDAASGGATSYIPLPADLITGTGITRDSLQSILRGNGTLTADQSLVPGGAIVERAETLTADSFDLVRGKSDPLDAITVNGSLNFTFGDIGLRLGGGYATQDRSEYSFTSSLYNRDTYYNSERDSYRLYGTLRQRLTNSAFYQLQGEFSDFRFVRSPNGYSNNLEDVLFYGDIQDPRNAVATRYYTYTGSSAANPNGTGQFVSQFSRDSGLRPDQLAGSTFSNPGRTNLTNFQKSHNQRYRFSGSATAQVGVNQIEFGGEYQQDTQRFFSIGGFGLAQFVNDADGGQAVGTAFPTGVTSYDQFDFETLRRRTSRFGFDYLGLNEVDDQDIDGYFPDASGNRSNTNIAPYSPVYYAGYIQDKIEFQDLVVQLGLRVDAFDNNTDVLLDLYAPTPIFRASTLATRPAGIEDDFAVYYSGDNVVGFRDLDGNFYDTRGTRTTNDAVIRDARGQVRSDASQPRSAAFRSYETQVTVMPRVGVSFPVTDRALFFASYNVTSQRPTENAFQTLSGYEELDGQTRINNSNLKPERTTQYELGFRQRLGERAAVSLSGFYRTQENKISVRNAAGGFPQYSTYFNADFTTTQGAEVNFDLRRTNNLQVNANYTLSFAQGTGSDANSTATAAWRGDFFPQSITPSDFDQRHTANVTLDYRLSEGDGPLVGGIRPFENFGINLIGQFGSGQRYTRLATNTGFSVGDSFTPNVSGTLNGSTLPATTRFDLRVDRAFDLGFSNARMRAYVQVQNLFDTRNRLAVYRATGQTDEDGFASTSAGQQTLNTPGRLFNYQAYTGGPLNVGGSQSSGAGSFYSAPRQVRLGFLFDF